MKNQMSNTKLRSRNRRIWINSLKVECTFDGCLEGTPETISESILLDLEKRLSKNLSSETALAILPCDQIPLPSYQFLMRLESPDAVRTDDSDYASSLTVCWFEDNLNRSIQEMIDWVIRQVDWEAQAKDYDRMP